ncbi:hypothetical protein Hamer_G015988 [Homarus americanus]|uniref:Uncharacterized protein n=1 Tax=Homarus americanus TaxID=6706 RepID=A0A8J5MLH9_HOMAM|nr:hypothetical protein Hamer_G015988 [Homarus americanus]
MRMLATGELLVLGLWPCTNLNCFKQVAWILPFLAGVVRMLIFLKRS